MLSRKLLVKRDSFVSEPNNKFLNCGHEIDSFVCVLSSKLLVKRDSFVSEPSNKFLNCGHEIDSFVCVPSSKLLVKVDSFDSACAGNVGFSTINLSVSMVYR